MVSLLLPSQISAHERTALGFNEAAEVELKLREGQACDALDEVRYLILSYNYNVRLKSGEVHRQYASTQSHKLLEQLTLEQRNVVRHYNEIRGALIRLGMQEDNPQFRPLLTTELWAKNTSSRRKVGDSHKPDPWFWTTIKPGGLSKDEEDEWVVESEYTRKENIMVFFNNPKVRRVKWFRDHADHDRWLEEIEILLEEERRAVEWHQKTAKIWGN